MTAVVYTGIGLLLVWALIRRPQWINVTLAFVFGMAILAAELAHGPELRSILMGFDALVVIAMWFLWGAYRSELAALVATLGFLKIWLGLASAAAALSWPAWAGANNAIFICQILVAGGFLDGIIAWVGRCHLRARDRRRGLHGHMEKIR